MPNGITSGWDQVWVVTCTTTGVFSNRRGGERCYRQMQAAEMKGKKKAGAKKQQKREREQTTGTTVACSVISLGEIIIWYRRR